MKLASAAPDSGAPLLDNAGGCGSAAPTAVKGGAPQDGHHRQQQRQQQQQQQQQHEPENVAPPAHNAYEQQRLERIERNQRILQQLGVDQAAAAVQDSMRKAKRQRTSKPKVCVWRGGGRGVVDDDHITQQPVLPSSKPPPPTQCVRAWRRQQPMTRLPSPAGAAGALRVSRQRCLRSRPTPSSTQRRQKASRTQVRVERERVMAVVVVVACCRLQQQQLQQQLAVLTSAAAVRPAAPAAPKHARASSARWCTLSAVPAADHAALLTQDEYFALQGQQRSSWESDGKFKG
jgi:hypothetical protein